MDHLSTKNCGIPLWPQMQANQSMSRSIKCSAGHMFSRGQESQFSLGLTSCLMSREQDIDPHVTYDRAP